MTEHHAAAIVVGLGTLYGAWVSLPLITALASRSWPRAEGHVVKVDSLYVTATSSRGMGAWIALEPAIRVEFDVDGRSYLTSRLRWTGSSLRQVRRAFERYTLGARVEVSYDPRDPQRSVLEPGASFEGIAPIAVGIVVAIGGFAWLLTTSWHSGTERTNRCCRRAEIGGRLAHCVRSSHG